MDQYFVETERIEISPNFHSRPQCEIKTQMEAKTVGIKTQMTNNQTILKPRRPTIKTQNLTTNTN